MSDATKILANSGRFDIAEVTTDTQLSIERFLQLLHF